MTDADQPNRLDRIERVIERQLTKSRCNKLSSKTPRRARSVPSRNPPHLKIFTQPREQRQRSSEQLN
jgi:hypothetical protein